ncbi:hypothetical protein C8J56DRAFT_929070 [Mycena floridula]|nr:hypothetical protein C8J56DRAFT_929070 [Mycena floridula]
MWNLFPLCLGLIVASTSLVSGSTPQPNYNTVVNLRIEGRDKTIFEGPISTRGHNVTTPSGGSHHCDGTNNGASKEPGPTCTSALDDASRIGYFPWDATFSAQFDDYFITSIGDSSQTSTQFWGLLLNWEFTPVGGCQERVNKGDEILWAFDAFSAVDFLKLEGPATAKVGKPLTLTVTDGSTGALIEGADVNEGVSDSNGRVTIIFGKVGTHGVKAQKEGSIRSNQLIIQVLP